MVAVGAPSSMPSRPFSAQTIGGLWPHTDPYALWDVAEGLEKKARELETNADNIYVAARQLAAEASGQTIDAMVDWCQRVEQTIRDHAKMYSTMAAAVSECAQLIYDARQALDLIDEKAHEEIERLKQLAASHRGVTELLHKRFRR